MTSCCPHCGVTSPADARFCMKCGREVGDREPPARCGPSAPAGPPAHPPTAPGQLPPAATPAPSDLPTATSAHPPTAPGHLPSAPATPSPWADAPDAPAGPAPVPPSAPTAPGPHDAYDTYDPYDPHILRPSHSAPSPQASHPTVRSPAVPPRRGPALVWAGTLAGALVIGGGAAAGLLLWEDRSAENTAVDTPQSSPSGTSAASGPTGPTAPARSASPTSEVTDGTFSSPRPSGETYTGGGVPDGYHRVTDPMGFSFAVPDGWGREGVERGTQVMYGGATGVERLQVGVIANAGYTSYENFVNLEKAARRVNDGYRRIRLEQNTFQGRTGAIWEYTYVDDAGRTIRALDQGYVAENGTEYAILAAGRDDAWSAGFRRTHQVALDSWHLT